MTFTISEDQNSAVLILDDGSVMRLAAAAHTRSCAECALRRYDGCCIPAEEPRKWPLCRVYRKDRRHIVWEEVAREPSYPRTRTPPSSSRTRGHSI